MLGTGERVFLGSKCGADAFGEKWINAKKRMERFANRQYELDRLDRIEALASAMKNGLFRWERPMQSVMARRLAFQSLGELSSRVGEAARLHGGQLTVWRDVDTKIATDAGMRVTAQALQIRVADLAGVDFFIFFDTASAVERAQKALENVLKNLPTDDVEYALMMRRRKTFEACFEDLQTAARIYRGAEAFFSKSNFRNIVDWSNKYRITSSRYVFDEDEGTIFHEDGRRGISLPRDPLPELDDTPLDLIVEYRRAE